MYLRVSCSYRFFTSIVLSLLISASVPKCNAETVQDVHDVLADFVDNGRYDKRIRGVQDQTRPVDVYVSFMFITIEHFGEVNEALETMAVLTMSWFDERLKWTPSDYNGTSRVYVFQNEVWRPEVSLSNPSQEVNLLGNDRIMVEVHYTGEVFWRVGNVFRTACPFNVRAYPWDKQECEIGLVVQGYSAALVRLFGRGEGISMNNYVPNGQWDIVGKRTVENNQEIAILHFVFILERRAVFELIFVIVPTLTLSALNMMVFFLPVQSGERMSYSITVLLSIAVLLTFVGDSLPKKSANVAAICYCIMNIMVMSVVICACTVVSLYLYHKGDDGDKPPHWIGRIISRCAKRSCRRLSSGKVKHSPDNDSAMDAVINTEHTATNLPSETDEMKKSIQHGVESAHSWVAVSRWMDSVCFTVMLLWLAASIVIYTYVVVVERNYLLSKMK